MGVTNSVSKMKAMLKRSSGRQLRECLRMRLVSLVNVVILRIQLKPVAVAVGKTCGLQILQIRLIIVRHRDWYQRIQDLRCSHPP